MSKRSSNGIDCDCPLCEGKLARRLVTKSGCDLVRCWAELPNAGAPLSSNTAEKILSAAVSWVMAPSSARAFVSSTLWFKAFCAAVA